ncbi:polysaccharide biosynthesis protein [Breznakia pachnodae]|uniref:O-antigen/teichoic acid export membrane protein n=1 Tax=Breznakia pachnodae TaxID=265178 RepID=A0ABU0E7I3_9FIRM|nr:polysaccharide biosynthesis protein [Breznakia pachnodae]MDQ0362863.1 O-antigen/teichoic acid export membrane protein [Breznakia pachnodae]
MSNRKQSLLTGGLISSAGLLISKFLSLFYTIPFDAILQTSENRAIYSEAYNVYSYILMIASAGLPFAIATLVSRYLTREDYKTALLVKKISFYTMLALGFICMCFMVIFSTPIATQIAADESSIPAMRMTLILLSLAIFIIPVLSSFRGFYQGMKEMQIYSASQVVEQIVRIVFLLGVSCIAIYVFNADRIWAVYFGVIATSVAGFLTILYIKSYDRKKVLPIKRLAKQQDGESRDSKELFKELIFLAIPFLITAVFGYCDTIINQWDFVPGMKAFGISDASVINLYKDGVYYKAMKLIAIPMILAPGFSSAIYPYITEARERRQPGLVQKYISNCVESVVYIALPICFALFVFAKPIIYTLYGPTGENLETYTMILKWFALEGLSATICPIFSSLVMSVGQRKKIIFTTMIFALIKIVTNRWLISMVGVGGMVLSSFIAYAIFAGLNIIIIQRNYKVKWRYTLRKIIFMLIGIGGFYLVSLVFNFFGMIDYTGNRIISLIYLGIMGIICCLAYFGITAYCHIPQSIFGFDLSTISEKFKGRFRK